MPNTYTQIHLQLVFAVKFRLALIENHWKNELYKYMTGIVQKYDHKLIIVNGMPDHVHMVVGMRPDQSISEMMQNIKGASSYWINNQRITKSKFQWQEGYRAFSYSKNDLPVLIDYVKNQELHHHKTSFLEEYRDLLNKFEIEYDERYLFRDPE
jgi:putative transposase